MFVYYNVMRPFSLQFWGLNPRPLGRETSILTSRPWLLVCNRNNFVCDLFLKVIRFDTSKPLEFFIDFNFSSTLKQNQFNIFNLVAASFWLISFPLIYNRRRFAKAAINCEMIFSWFLPLLLMSWLELGFIYWHSWPLLKSERLLQILSF